MGKTSYYCLSALLLLYFSVPQYCSAKYNITSTETITDGETLVSGGDIFELGFFSPRNSSSRYVGMWYKELPNQKIVWVANREKPLSDSSGVLKIGENGNIVLLDGAETVIWSTNVTGASNNSMALLLDAGNLVLVRGPEDSNYIWQSFNHLSDTQLESMLLGVNTRTGENYTLRSWRAEDDPSPGEFVVGVGRLQLPQLLIWKASAPYWRSGEWNGTQFIGMPDLYSSYINGTRYTSEGGVYFTYSNIQNGDITFRVINSTGSLVEISWYKGETGWAERSRGNMFPPRDQCDIYNTCGPFGSCSIRNQPNLCSCLRGYEPKDAQEWNRGNWTGGCVRRTQLQCQENTTSQEEGKEDGFVMLEGMKVPDHSNFMVSNAAQCEDECTKNCSCIAYATIQGIGCLAWGGDLVDMRNFQSGGQMLFLRLAHSELGEKKGLKAYIIVLIAGSIIFSILAFALCIYKIKRRGENLEGSREASPEHFLRDNETERDQLELPSFDFDKVAVATSYFSNKLGEGGFGPVYKGKLPDGLEIAVKRLSKTSGQGVVEFKNELKLISKLQHRNLVRLLGYCIDKDEKILLYEYMPNKSLDGFLFDPSRRVELDWVKRFNIIDGIARGLLYLHRDSRLKIIHRDLKVSNILLDEDMNSKISDFGMARIFGGKQTLANTNRVVGTYGYMSPEYAMGGIFSEKSDVFSFGVLLLEIISSKRNNSNTDFEGALNLLGHAWQLWNEDKVLELMDPTLLESYIPQEVVRCIHLGLLCVQEHPVDRPNMQTLVSMFGSDATLPVPDQPAFTPKNKYEQHSSQSHSQDGITVNGVTITTVEGR